MSSTKTWPIFMAKLKNRDEVAEGTMAFHFEKPSDWTFQAGQFVYVTLINPPETDAEGDKRVFTIVSAPHEDTIMVASRMRDTAFKRCLKTIPLGSEAKIEGAFGKLTLHEDASRPAVFLTGGIGITPFRSIIVSALHEKRAHRLFLFYSNHRPEDAPFLDELGSLASAHPSYKCIATMTQMDKSSRSWQGETGQIGADMLAKYLVDVVSPVYYIAGPPNMVKGLQAVLAAGGIAPSDIRTEAFAGY